MISILITGPAESRDWFGTQATISGQNAIVIQSDEIGTMDVDATVICVDTPQQLELYWELGYLTTVRKIYIALLASNEESSESLEDGIMDVISRVPSLTCPHVWHIKNPANVRWMLRQIKVHLAANKTQRATH